MLDPKKINEMVDKVMDALPKGLIDLPKDLQKNCRSLLQSTLSKMDLVTREEFDAQAAVLARTRAKLEELEKKLNELEK